MALCSFRNCPMKRNPKGNVSYYPFPSNPELFTKWVESVNRGPDWEPKMSDYVCHFHFPKVCFIDDMLKENAVPQLNPHSSNNAKSVADNSLNSPDDSIKLSFDSGSLKKSMFGQMCRLCGKSDDQNMKDIYDNGLEILEKISVCLPILVLPNDGLPMKVCSTCQGQLDVCFALIQVTVATDEKLKKFIEFHKNKLERKKELNKIRKSETLRLQLRGPIDCDICGVHFMDMNKFDEHMKQHSDDTPEPPVSTENLLITCNECGYLFREKADYDNHKSKRNSKCRKCNGVMQSVCDSHTHECPRKYCFICCKQFQRKKKFASHMERVHNIKVDLSGKGEECSTCHIVHSVPDELKNHSCDDHRTTEGNCSLCSQIKSQCPPAKITKTPWICKYCGKCMTTKLSLNIHERIHSGAKPFMCEWCGNEFRSKSNLLQHQLIHTGVRNHSCHVCGKSFSRKSFVRSHMRVHTGERPYQCEICRQRFTQIGDMRRHRNRHHTLMEAAAKAAANQAGADYSQDNLDFLRQDETVDYELENAKIYLDPIEDRNGIIGGDGV